ncbi:MAG: GAF domain-containing protein [Chloroflexi bacterium]|nr:GAF domain-containing protein [Chloroflexota bacterium]
MFRTLEGRFYLLFLAFVLLVMISVGLTTWELDTQRQDALLINLSGRQRMLAQQMGRLAFEAGVGEDANNAALQESSQVFEQTLLAMLDGGTIPYSPEDVVIAGTQDPQIRSALDQVNLTWNDYRAMLDILQHTSSEASTFAPTIRAIEQKSTTLVQQADLVVRLFEAGATARVYRLRLIQIGFLVGAFVLLIFGAWTTRRSVLLPLNQLGLVAVRLGENDLDTVIQVEGTEEMSTLSRSFNSMRLSLRASRQDLVRLNDSLEERVVQRTHELEMLNEVSREISSRLDIQQVLNSVTDKARTLLGGDVASLCLMDENQYWLKLQAVSGPQDAVNTQAVRADEELAGTVLKSNHAVICGVDACYGGCRMLADPYRTSHLAAPLRVGERVIGALCVGSPAQNRFAGESSDMLTKLANAAAIALENARLYAQAERVATLEERHRVAAEMHDGLGQTLSYLGLMTDQAVEFLSAGKDDIALAHLQKARNTIQDATAEVRRAINNLMNESPNVLDLRTRLQNDVNEFAVDANLPIEWLPDAEFSPDSPRQVTEQVLNVTREALNNVVRHAQAQHITVKAGTVADNYFVSIQDDGQGFDSSQPEPSGHFGLQIMRSRAALIGGQTEIESMIGSGARVTLIWPMKVKG